MKALAIGGEKRSSFLPNVATFAEQDFPTVNTNVNFGVFVRSGTPANIVDRINRDFVTILKTLDFQRKFLDPRGIRAGRQFTFRICRIPKTGPSQSC